MDKRQMQITRKAYDHLLVKKLELEQRKTDAEKTRREITDNSDKHRNEDNSELHSIEEEIITLNTQLKEAERVLKAYEVVLPEHQKDVVKIGNEFVLAYDEETERRFLLDGVSYKQEEFQVVGVETPVGMAVIGKKEGDQVIITCPGNKKLSATIQKIEFPTTSFY